ncbi:MAG: 4Fe-4S binding protein [Deltaproteobacteria bacterium]|jgi:NAD-dependent dihydropyrimidine dehydrogenase PreA subunit|nr:4Fe-4S binding protein [Deltaproteobacteria bacterium]
MLRQIITIDEDKCDGCGACADACREGAIGMRQGKAVLLRDEYCDGLGACLPACPANAISVEERDALPYDEAAVREHVRAGHAPLPCGCPGGHARLLNREEAALSAPAGGGATVPGELRQWPVQIRLAPAHAAFFSGADLLIAADCAAYAHGNFHAEFMRGRVTLIGCPKLDAADYGEKLGEICRLHALRSVTLTRMGVPCCSGLEEAVREAMRSGGKGVPGRRVVLSTEGVVLESGAL